eukprot:CAMPEP_0168517054 /NCGR_PEP_ID=MMETSP0405-20121227/5796_1 /TAXON_ID=498012 /ORGANISM="Trichosphaerium sp, Strain Am-I-7 wt" /LENGTH=413 /DNA_ID=CAMNT_0008536937 /DNA_START=1071 /DNA_END=2309 /DNA_ORIENTATION=-
MSVRSKLAFWKDITKYNNKVDATKDEEGQTNPQDEEVEEAPVKVEIPDLEVTVENTTTRVEGDSEKPKNEELTQTNKRKLNQRSNSNANLPTRKPMSKTEARRTHQRKRSVSSSKITSFLKTEKEKKSKKRTKKSGRSLSLHSKSVSARSRLTYNADSPKKESWKERAERLKRERQLSRAQTAGATPRGDTTETGSVTVSMAKRAEQIRKEREAEEGISSTSTYKKPRKERSRRFDLNFFKTKGKKRAQSVDGSSHRKIALTRVNTQIEIAQRQLLEEKRALEEQRKLFEAQVEAEKAKLEADKAETESERRKLELFKRLEKEKQQMRDALYKKAEITKVENTIKAASTGNINTIAIRRQQSNRMKRRTFTIGSGNHLSQGKVLWDYTARSSEEMNLSVGDIVTIMQTNSDGW